MDKIIGLRELRENMPRYEEKIKHGQSFVVVKKSKPIFRISPFDENENLWEEVIDFTKITKGGVAIDKLLARLCRKSEGNEIFVLTIARRNEKTYRIK